MLALLASIAFGDPYYTPVFSQDGAVTSLQEQANGERLVVVVMKGSWCPVCIGQLNRLDARADEIARLGATVVGLDADSVAQNATLRDKIGWPVLADPGKSSIHELDLWMKRQHHPRPGIVVFDRCGREHARVVGRAPGLSPDEALFQTLRAMKADPARCGQTNS